jgi:predicted peptidase
MVGTTRPVGIALLLLLLGGAVGFASDLEPRRFEVKVESRFELDYLLYLPPGYDGGKDERWPLILFLHGAGGYGDSLEAVKKGGLPKILAGGRDLPAIVVAPQAKSWWDETIPALLALLDEVERTHRVDSDRIYAMGVSAGGSGVWALITQEPARFAAAIPICGAGSRAGIKRLVDLPIWVFHGEQDPVQPLEESTRLVEAIKAQGGAKVKLTVYPDVGHDAWSHTHDDPAVWEWLFAQRRARAKEQKGE